MNPKYYRLYNEIDASSSAGSAAAAPEAAPPTFNPDGTFGENWHSTLGDEFAPHAASLKDFKDVKGLAKSYLHFRSTGPAYPTEQAAPEDITRFHSLAKVPAEGTPTAYGIQIPEGISDVEKGMYDRIAAAAHKHHGSAPAVAAIVAEYQAIQAEVLQAEQSRIESEMQAAEDALVSKWGGKMEENKSIARHMLSTLAAQAGISPEDPAFAAALNNPAIAQIAVEMSKLTAEGSTRVPANYGDIRSPMQKANSIMDGSDPIWGKKYTEGSDEERLSAYNEVVRLQKLANE